MATSLKIESYSHGHRITGFDVDTLHKTTRFLETLSLKEPERVRNRMVMALKKRYYGMTENKRELFIHRNSLDDYVNFLKEAGYPTAKISYNQVPVPASEPAVYQVDPKFVPRDYQVTIIDELADDLYSRRLDLQTGGGKGSVLTAKIRVPGGWSTMGDMKVGTKIVAPDGTITEVTGVYPQGLKPTYKVTFWDGRSTEVDDTHLWEVYYVNTVIHRRWRVVNTLEVARLISMPNPRVYVRLIEPEDQSPKEFPIPPYTLGVILGDGYIGKKMIQVSKSDLDLFANMEEELLPGHKLSPQSRRSERCLTFSFITDGTRSNNGYLKALKDMGLGGANSYTKFIPEEYLEGSKEQRLALLRGLLDTDGTVSHDSSTVSFCSTSYRLAQGVQYLVRSLGGIASISIREPHYTHNGEKKKGRIAYQVNIRYPRPTELFRIQRKKERTYDHGQYSSILKLRVKSVVYSGLKETQCISVAHPDRLYITDDFIVTHNTFCTLKAVADMGVRALVMVPPKYYGIWETALEETYGDSVKWRKVSGSGELKKLIIDALDGLLEEEVILMSCVSYRNYIEAYEKYADNIEQSGYMVPPPRFHETIGAGVQINDEFQEDPGLYFRIDLYSNVAKQIYLSATPYTGNAYVTKMIDVMTPFETLCTLPDWNKFIDAVALLYSDPSVKPKDYLTPFKNTYNHARYETQMLKNKKRLEFYLRYVRRAVEGLYVRDREPGQKALVLCATVKFIHMLTKFLKKEFPDLVINYHVSGSPYEQVGKNDITVSTIKSAGTGVDIPNLRETILLQASGSEKDNVQIMGRTRVLKDWPDVTPRFSYFACNNIPQHLRYMREKQEYLKGKARYQRMARL